MATATAVPKPSKRGGARRSSKPKDSAIQVYGGDMKMPAVPGEITPTSLKLNDDLEFEPWCEFGSTLFSVRQGTAWWIGDWILHGEAKYGEQYAQAVDATQYDAQTLANMASVANRVAPENRRSDLSWTHHSHVAKFKPADQRKWLERAFKNGWSSVTLRQAIKDEAAPATPVEATVADLTEEATNGAAPAITIGEVVEPEALDYAEEDEIGGGDMTLEEEQAHRLKERILRMALDFDPLQVKLDELADQFSDSLAEKLVDSIPGLTSYLDQLVDTLEARLQGVTA